VNFENKILAILQQNTNWVHRSFRSHGNFTNLVPYPIPRLRLLVFNVA